MADNDTSLITEVNKVRLADFLLDRVLRGLAGRDGDDLVGVTPSRVLFAGVLLPLRQPSGGRPTQGISDAPVGTSLGLDFRLKPHAGAHTIRLRVRPCWSVYYPVFPKREHTVRANGAGFGSVSSAPDETEPADEEAPNEGPDADTVTPLLGKSEPEPPPPPEQEPPPRARQQNVELELPRVWRRYKVAIDEFFVDMPTDRDSDLDAGQFEMQTGLAAASEAIANDPDGWRHLGDPSERRRTIPDANILHSENAYQSALRGVGGERVVPPPWKISVQVDAGPDPGEPGAMRVRVLLANWTPDQRPGGRSDGDCPDPLLQERAVFDAGLNVIVEGGDLVPFQFLLAPKDYRANPIMPAKGINCVAVVDPESKGQLATETLPVFRQPLYRTRDELQVTFATLDLSDPTPELERVATAMDHHLSLWNQFLESDVARQFSPDEAAACERDRDQFRAEIDRYRLGIETLRRDSLLLDSFRLMNRVFGRLAAKSGGRVRAWRLFQIGFIVSQLPALAIRRISGDQDDEYAVRLREAFPEVAVLWFPTGGGKTEAYLGLIATAVLYDRLRGKTRGVTAWMRFPLRMLSLQQLERLARVIAALNELRPEERRIGTGDPFAIGYYVGDANTPNAIDARRMKRLEERDDQRERLRLLRRCPFCGDRVDIRLDRKAWRAAHVCQNAACFSNTSPAMGAYRGSLPVCVVDNEIYRFLPSVLVGTVDKLAIAGRNRHFAQIVRGARQQCRLHGYTSYDECIEQGQWTADCKAKKAGLVALPPVPDPGIALLIQDELHLLRDELGVFNGHYEGLLQYLGAKAHLPPKVLAATATIEAYDVQAFHIYLKRSRRYPQPSWEAGESFYATSKPPLVRRMYAGVLGHTRAIEETSLRVLALYLLEVRRLMTDLRKAAAIMGRPEASDDAVREVLQLYDLSLAYVNKKTTGGSIIDKVPSQIDEILTRENLGPVQSQLLTADQTLDDVGATLERIERERQETGEPRLNLVVATNLISHGVDLERINMMTICGMPSHYAEYVQSTSRAARMHAGLVFVCFRARDPREVSQYEFFSSMHSHIDRLIEAVAVNRFASYAPKKTVPGLLAGVLLHDLSPELFSKKQISRPLNHVPTLQTALGMRPAAKTGTSGDCIDPKALRAALLQIIGVDGPHPPASPAQITNVRARVDEVFAEILSDIRRSMDSQLSDALQPLTSFRDVDEGIDFGSFTSSGLIDHIRSR
jgi:hypothetical protein